MSLYEIGRYRIDMLAYRGYFIPSPLLYSYSSKSHQTSHPVPADLYPITTQLTYHPPATVTLSRPPVYLSDSIQQLFLLQHFIRSFPIGVIATATYRQHPAEHPDRIFMTITTDKPILYPDSLAKYAAAFFSISFSIFNCRFSSRSRFSSSFSVS